jgi:hypothetical protein
VHWQNGVFATKNGVELPLVYAMTGIVFALAGYGQYSLDAVVGLAERWPATLTWIVLALGIAGGLVNAQIRRRAPAGV